MSEQISTSWRLGERDSSFFTSALSNPPEPSPHIKVAVKRYRERIKHE